MPAIKAEVKKQIIDLHAEGASIGEIRKITGKSYHTVRSLVDPAHREMRKSAYSPTGAPTKGYSHNDPRPPAEALQQREAAASRPYDIRYDVLGEPPPGRSALDKRNAQQSMKGER